MGNLVTRGGGFVLIERIEYSLAWLAERYADEREG